MLLLTDCTNAKICLATALQWLMSCVCDASLQLDALAPWAAAIHWMATAAACLAAISSFLMGFFLRVLEAAALVTALRGDERAEVTY